MKSYRADGYTNYYDTTVLPSGQTIRIEFLQYWSNDKYFYNIYLVISHKRKQAEFTYNQTTGKDGLLGLLWAKRKIIEFEEFIKTEHERIPVIIFCYWTDNRRRNVYERGLSSIGYKYNMLFGEKVLSKRI